MKCVITFENLFSWSKAMFILLTYSGPQVGMKVLWSLLNIDAEKSRWRDFVGNTNI